MTKGAKLPQTLNFGTEFENDLIFIVFYENLLRNVQLMQCPHLGRKTREKQGLESESHRIKV